MLGELRIGVWTVGLQKSQPGEPHVWAAKRGLHVSDVVQKRRWSGPHVLPLLDDQLFQLVVDTHAFSVAVQRSGYVVGVEGNPRQSGAEEEDGLAEHQKG